MKDAVDYAFVTAVALSALTASGHAVIHKRDSRSAAIWVLLIWILPALGPVLYALLGVNRVERRAARMRRGMVRHRTDPQFPASEPGSYSFKARFSMEGRWQLSLGAKVQGETGTVDNKLVITAQK